MSGFYMTMADVVRTLKIARHRIAYALESGRVPEPARIQNRRMFTKDDLALMQAYFSKKEAKHG